jgi:hypothetical protein
VPPLDVIRQQTDFIAVVLKVGGVGTAHRFAFTEMVGGAHPTSTMMSPVGSLADTPQRIILICIKLPRFSMLHSKKSVHDMIGDKSLKNNHLRRISGPPGTRQHR